MTKVYVIPIGVITMSIGLILDFISTRLPWGIIYDPTSHANIEVYLPHMTGDFRVIYIMMLSAMLLALGSALSNIRDYRKSTFSTLLAMLSATSTAVSIMLFIILSWSILRLMLTGVHIAMIALIVKLLGAVLIKAPLGAIVVEVVKPHGRYRYQIMRGLSFLSKQI